MKTKLLLVCLIGFLMVEGFYCMDGDWNNDTAPYYPPAGCDGVGCSSEDDFPYPVTPNPTKLSETNYFYISYDDSASTVGVELTKAFLNDSKLPDPSYARAWEFLNYEELHFNQTEQIGLFRVNMNLWNHRPTDPSIEKDVYELGVEVTAPYITKAERDNAVITLIVDVSGSMSTNLLYNSGETGVITRLDAVQLGLLEMVNSIKSGDIINMVQFSNDASTVLENYLVVEGDNSTYTDAVRGLQPIGSTNLDAGIQLGYQKAQASFDQDKTNRVIILTDAYANTGEVDSSVISEHTRINNAEGIYFSGLGVGEDFNEAFLNELTEEGRGAYFAIITPNDARRAFKDRFIALMNVAATDVRFRIDYPQIFQYGETASEEVSTDPEEVQPTNFSYNTSQFFLEAFYLESNQWNDAKTSEFKLTITYRDPATYTEQEEVFTFIAENNLNTDVAAIKDAYLVNLLPGLINGSITVSEGNARLNLLSDYESSLANEYRDLVNTWLQLKGY